jgi:hypothetical protein
MIVLPSSGSGLGPTNGEINLGTRFTVSVRGLEQFERVAVDLREAYTELLRAGGTPFGDWTGVIGLLESIPERVRENLERASATVGIMHGEDIRSAWDAQALEGDWKALSADYLAWKIARGLDSRTLIATGDALNSLGYQLEPMGVIVGVTAESEDGVPYMVVQEFGSDDGRIPPRPLFLPTLEANVDRYVGAYAAAVQMALEGKLYPVKSGVTA